MNPINAIRPSARPRVTFRNKLFFFWCGVVSPSLSRQASGPPHVGCHRLLIQYIRSYSPYLRVVSFFRIPRTRHAVVTGTYINMGFLPRSLSYNS